MQRYFAKLINNSVVLDESDVHHVLHVMRMKKGDNIETVVDGKCYISEIVSIEPFVLQQKEQLSFNSEIDKDVTLFFALAKGEKIDFVIQKATELGAKKIVLIKSEYCVVKMDDDDFKRKLARYQKIAKEASEQSHRLFIPDIKGVYDIKNIPQSLLCDVNYVAYEKDNGKTTNTFNGAENAKSVSILIGAEGGISPKEIEILNKQGFVSTSLGKRILRTETAAVYALSVLSYLLEK